MFSAKGAVHASLGQRPREELDPKPSAESADQRRAIASIPHIAFIEFDAVLAQKTTILLLKTAEAMVLGQKGRRSESRLSALAIFL
jgi:hypothetical protein